MTAYSQYVQLYFLLFAPFALHVTYLTLFYQRRGFTNFQIGVLEAVGSVCIIASPFVWGPLGDRVRRKSRLIAALALGMALFFPLLWYAPRSLWLCAPLVAGLYLCRAPLIPLIDASFLDELAARGDSGGETYGRVRIAGSVGFMVAATVLPLVLADELHADPLRRLAPVFAAFALVALLLALRAATLREPSRHAAHEQLDRGHLRAVLALPQYKRLLALLVLSWLCNQSYYLFFSLYLESTGVPDRLKGVYWSMGVLAEVVLLAAGPWLLRRYGVRRMILAGFAGRALRLFAFCLPHRPLVTLFIFQPLHALAFAAVHLGTMAFLARTVPSRLRATGQVLNAGLVTGVGGVAGSLLAGWVSDYTRAGHPLCGLRDIHAAFFAMGVIQTVVLLVAWLKLREPPPAEAPVSA